MKPYYDDGRVTVYHGDAREVLPELQAGAADLVLTDPPYGADKAAWDEAFPEWWLDDAARIAPCLGVMPGVVNIGRLPQSIGRLEYRWTLCAHISNGMTRSPFGFGNWIPCLVYAAEDVRLHGNRQDARSLAIRGAMPDHPSPKPVSVMAWLVDSLPGDVILDPFMGSGTTLRAALDAGRRAIGVEVEERYCEAAVARLAQQSLFAA